MQLDKSILRYVLYEFLRYPKQNEVVGLKRLIYKFAVDAFLPFIFAALYYIYKTENSPDPALTGKVLRAIYLKTALNLFFLEAFYVYFYWNKRAKKISGDSPDFK